MIDFGPLKEGKQTLGELGASLSKQDLWDATDEMIGDLLGLLTDAVDADIVFVPSDPKANDPGASEEEKDMAWTFGHLICHVTSSNEEAALTALAMASGILPNERLRYETPWRDLQTLEQARQRLEESRRMCLSMLDAWPDQPHLEISKVLYEAWGPLNAHGRYFLGLKHLNDHVEQFHEVMRQAKAARS